MDLGQPQAKRTCIRHAVFNPSAVMLSYTVKTLRVDFESRLVSYVIAMFIGVGDVVHAQSNKINLHKHAPVAESAAAWRVKSLTSHPSRMVAKLI
jgi:hypothetical protein